MENSEVTIKKLLDDDDLKVLADKIVSENIQDVILIYRDKESKCICWQTSIRDWAKVFGSYEMIRELMYEEWHNQMDIEGGIDG